MTYRSSSSVLNILEQTYKKKLAKRFVGVSVR